MEAALLRVFALRLPLATGVSATGADSSVALTDDAGPVPEAVARALRGRGDGRVGARSVTLAEGSGAGAAGGASPDENDCGTGRGASASASDDVVAGSSTVRVAIVARAASTASFSIEIYSLEEGAQGP